MGFRLVGRGCSVLRSKKEKKGDFFLFAASSLFFDEGVDFDQKLSLFFFYSFPSFFFFFCVLTHSPTYSKPDRRKHGRGGLFQIPT